MKTNARTARVVKIIVETIRPQFGVELWDGTRLGSSEGNLKERIKAIPKWQLLKDIPSLLMSGNRSKSDQMDGKSPFVSGSDKQAITHHYDVSNEFYQLFLDKRMVYTCGYFTDWANNIDQAQEDKLELITRKLRLQPGEHFLDIGCGWGALLIYAVKNFGVIGTGVSLSEA